ncbi:PREDICTED: uncharacterized protein LOC107174153 [Diuraphis noxia]|uniref:uncharacterized protein LOC107174153 n=1 Tax=Diuraphis noxia TaxID=143948 RepID=UPI0007637C03|nr:PREDICTED: uncharacterized protein LOC107174153 [Diuraphis noxia]
MVAMKKLNNSRGAEPAAEASESVKKLYKSINEVSHFLDDQRGRSLSCKDLFTASVDTQRIKLKNYCERMMLADPLCYGRKAEDIMWRKTYYDVYSTAKILRKNNDWSHMELALIENHFQSGIGSYYHLLFKFQAEIKFNKPELFDFYLLINDETDNIVKKDHITVLKKNDTGNKEEASMKQLVYRCLICLGDLSRYLYELNKLDLYYSTACRYYKQALNYKPANGLPHNQIGRLALSNKKHLDAVYHYVRCVFSFEPFEGGEKNLLLSLQQQSEAVGNIFLEKMFSVFYLWYTGEKDSGPELDKIYSSIISLLQNFADFKNKINTADKKNEINKDDTLTPSVKDTIQFLSTNENVFKIVVIIIACLNKLHKEESKCIPKAELFFLSLMEHLIGQSVTYCVKNLPLLVNPNIDHVKLNRRRRRRGFRQNYSPDSQEWSGDEAESVISPDDECDESDESEEEMLIYDMKRPNNDKSKNESDGSNDSGTSSYGCENKNNPKSPLLNLPFIEAIKIYFDWIQPKIDSINPETSVEFFNNTVTLLNYLSQANIELDIETNQYILPEEMHLRGMTVFSKSKKHCGEYDGNICSKNETDEKSLKDAKRDKQHVMGQLWLRSEVDNLEYKMKHYSSRKKSLPTCIVIDTDALINYSSIIKKLVNSTNFIVVVPAIVISALDEQKKLSKEVRLTIRWLEIQLQEGNCNLKSQGIHESLPIKLDSPPKLSKEICNFKHILECCNYFTEEYGENTGLVTLITGSDDLLESSELMEMAKSVKINIEHIKTFQFQLKTAKNKG